MKEQTRRSILRYGIAIDLVILATGVGMLVPATPSILLFVYAAAVALSVWRGGWHGGLTALLLSAAALFGVFPDVATPANLAMFFVAAIAGSVVVMWATRPRPVAEPEDVAEHATGPVVERATGPVAVPPLEDFAQQPLQRTPLAEVVPLEAERIRQQEREAAERELQERLAAERRAIEEEAERQRVEAEAERVRLENELREQREAEERQRVEAEAARRVAEEEAARLRAETERAAAEAERAAAEEEAARRVAEEEAARVAAEAERVAAEAEAARRVAEEEAARQRAEVERVAAEAEAARRAAEEEAERQRVEEERVAAEAEAARRATEEEAARQRAEMERVATEAEAARRAAEEDAARQRAEMERVATEAEAARRVAEEQSALQRASIEAERQRLEAERHQLEQERQAMRAGVEQELAAERERIAREVQERVAAASAAASAAPPAPAKPAPLAAPKTSLIDTVTGWFRRDERPRTVNLKTKRVPTNGVHRTQSPSTAPRPSASTASAPNRPRILLIERRRATADTIAPKLKHRGVEIDVVERWVDAVDEIFRFKPHAIFLDIEHPEFERMHRTVSEKSGQMPIVLTGRAGSTPPGVKRAAFVGRPYDVEEVLRIAQTAHARPEELLAEQLMPRTQPVRSVPAATMVPAPSLRAPVAPPKPSPAPIPVARIEVMPVVVSENANDYEIICFNCRSPFDAIEADWCSCLAKERTLVCTNCLTCFCKAPPAYKEKFWVAAPPRLFERKTAEARKQGAALRPNPSSQEVKRPLVLAVEDDEEIQVIVQRVCANLEYGFIWAMNGQDGLDLAREYRPNLILSDAFMPKLDGREMCRLLKEDPSFVETRMVVMTGLYTDTKYRSEAVKRFHVDDYVAKPVAITDLINLLQKHLEGVIGLPIQEDLHELHRQHIDLEEQLETSDLPMDGVALSDLLPDRPEMVPVARVRTDAYDVCCFNCQQTFDATRADWCSCVGRDNTLVCHHCGGCFCKAPATYRERFWIDAPPSLFERKMIGSKRNLGARANPTPAEVKRPLILLVEDDENVQLIVRTVVSNMGYGFVVGADGQEGLTLAREYGPDMILSDAFMPKLDGREMCRLLKEDPNTARSKAVIMTGLYTDRKYRNEALDYFKVDDYVAKPLAVDDLIKLFKKHLPQEVPQEVTSAH